MFRFVAKLLGVVIGASLVAGAASAIAALDYRKRAPARPGPGADEIDLVAVMDGTEHASVAPAFRGGRAICWYAALDLDLREATLAPEGASLEVRTVFGGTRVVVAPGVPVRVTGPAIFGGVMNSTGGPEPTADAPGLEITGFTLFGGLQVIASERGEEIPAWAGEREHEQGDAEHDEHAVPALEVLQEMAPA